MAGVNKVILIGNLGSDPEVKYLDGGSVVARFNIATTEAYNNRNGERVEQTEWHRIELWDNLAKIAEQYLRKGNPVYIEGKLRTETWQDKDGIQKSSVRIRATGLQLLGGRPGSSEQESGYEANSSHASAPASRPSQSPTHKRPDPVPFETNNDQDDLPF